MIDRDAALTIKRQAQLLSISRGTVSYHREPIAEAELAQMRGGAASGPNASSKRGDVDTEPAGREWQNHGLAGDLHGAPGLAMIPPGRMHLVKDHGVFATHSGLLASVSPNWDPSKATTHNAVPTWNDAVAHAHGTLRVRDDVTWQRECLPRLTATHGASQPRPWSLADAREDHQQKMMRVIVGIEIPLTRLVGKVKSSQNRSAGDREGVAQALSARAMAGA